MIGHVLGWLIAAAVLGVASLVINGVLILLKVGNVKTLRFLTQLRRVLRDVPDDVLLSCSGRDVALIHFDIANKTEKAIPMYTGVVTWKGGPRVASKIKRQVRRQLTLRSLPFLLVFTPLLLGSVFITAFYDWRTAPLVGLLVFHQFVPFYIWDYPGLSGLFEGK